MSSQRLRACAVAATTAVLLSGCADDDGARNHLGYEKGVSPEGAGITFLEGLALYVLAPALILLVVATLVWLPGMVRTSRYRPGRGWTAAPLWFGGPPDPVAAVENAETGDVVRGGASGDW